MKIDTQQATDDIAWSDVEKDDFVLYIYYLEEEKEPHSMYIAKILSNRNEIIRIEDRFYINFRSDVTSEFRESRFSTFALPYRTYDSHISGDYWTNARTILKIIQKADNVEALEAKTKNLYPEFFL